MTRLALALAGLVALAQPSFAAEYALGEITVSDPFARETPPSVSTGAAYMIVINSGADADRLVAMETPAASSVEFHRTVIEAGQARMVPVTGGLEIPGAGQIVIGEDGTHIMLIGVVEPLRRGETIAATLIFERAGRLPVVLEIVPLATTVGHGGGHGQ